MSWVKIKTPSQRRIYYHNPETDVTAWDLPPGAELMEEEAVSVEEGVKRGYKRESLAVPSFISQLGINVDRGSPSITKKMHTRITKNRKTIATTTTTTTSTRKPMNSKLIGVKEAGTNRKQRTKLGSNGKGTKNPSAKKNVRDGKSSAEKRAFQSERILRLRPEQLNYRSRDKQRSDGGSTISTNSDFTSLISKKKNKRDDTSSCEHFTTMPFSVWVIWLVPTLLFLAAGWYNYDANEEWTDEFRPATPNNTIGAPVEMLRLGTDIESMKAYADMNISITKYYVDDRNGENEDCKASFEAQVDPKVSALCEGYCQICALGGDTQRYKELPWAMAGFWSVIFVGATVLFPMLRNKLCKNPRKFDWSNLRVFLLLLFIVTIFSIILFLIHQSRVIAVPQGHSMFTFWVFYSSYFFFTTLIYWLRMDVQLIKARNPEIAIGGAICGYIIMTNAVAAYYLTGIQTWPCIISMITFYIIYPAYFLSFTRRGLELWVVVNHHKKLLKKMKSEEFDTLDASDDDDSDDENKINRSRSRIDDQTYDPEVLQLKIAKKLKLKKKRDKLKKKIAKERRKRNKKQNTSCCNCLNKPFNDDNDDDDIELGEYNRKNKNKKKNHDLNFSRTKSGSHYMNNPAIGLKHSNNNGTRSSIGRAYHPRSSGSGVGSRAGKRRLSAIDLKADMEHHKAGRELNGKKKKFYKSKANLVKIIYWLIIFCGIIFCCYRYFGIRYKGEVGCIARQGNLMYFLVGCAVLIFQLITLFLLRKVKDEFAIRRELFFVTIASLSFMLPHIIMLFYAQRFGGGCHGEFVKLRAGVAFNNKPCTIAFYAYWLLLILVTIIHTATISFPVSLTLAQGALKLREQSIITAANYKGPKLLTSFESAVSDTLCSKYFRRFLAQEFTLDNMRFLVDVENFKTLIDPSYVGVLKKFGHGMSHQFNNMDKASPPAFARACHTISAWQALSGNMPITMLSNTGRSLVKRELDLIEMTQIARDIVKRYFSNEFWCKLYDVKLVKNQFITIFKTLTNIMEELESNESTNATKFNYEAKMSKLTKLLFEVFDYTMNMVYKSLTEISYPKFVSSDIGNDLKERLGMNIETREKFGNDIF